MLHRMVYSYVRSHLSQIIRFSIVGIVTFVLYYILIWCFYGRFEFDYRLAVSCSYVITVAVHFLVNRFFTYRKEGFTMIHDTFKYLIMLAVNYVITLGITMAGVEIFGFSPYFAVLFPIAMTAVSSFLMMKHFVFAGTSVRP